MRWFADILKWFACVAVVEWFLNRTITRAAIHIPKTELFITLYQFVSWLGQFSLTLLALLVLVVLIGLIWHEWQKARLGLAFFWLSYLLVSPLFLWVPFSGGFALFFQVWVMLGSLAIWGESCWPRPSTPEKTVKPWLGIFPLAVLWCGWVYQLLSNGATWLQWSTVPEIGQVMMPLGEILLLATAGLFWWFYGRGATWKVYGLAFIPAGIFLVVYARSSALTAILAIWSMGLTLYLPWPFYVIALWFWGSTILHNWSQRPLLAWGMMLFLAVGYAPQISTQIVSALVALWLVTRPEEITLNQPNPVLSQLNLQPFS